MDIDLSIFSNADVWFSLFALVVMEVVLGIDNLIFVAILTNKLPEHQRERARFIGIGAAVGLRLMLLALVAWIIALTEPVFTLFEQSFSWRDIILIIGGFFLIGKATTEMHHHVDPEEKAESAAGKTTATMGAVIVQILLLDLVFSADSILTAVGMTPHIIIMVMAVVIASVAMLTAANPLSNFVAKNPTVVTLALGFLLLIGMTLVAEGFHVHVPKGYVYAAMVFSGFIEGMNMARRNIKRRQAEKLAAQKSE